MRGKGALWGATCALLVSLAAFAAAGSATAEECTTASATVTEDVGGRWTVCPSGVEGPGAPEAWPDVPGAPEPPGGSVGPPDGSTSGFEAVFTASGGLQFGVTRCDEVTVAENDWRRDTNASFCVQAEAEGPERLFGILGIETDPCTLEGAEGVDPRVTYAGGGVAACANADVYPGDPVVVDTDDCPGNQAGDPTITVDDKSVQICPEDVTSLLPVVGPIHVPGAPGGPGAPEPGSPDLPSGPGSLYAIIRNATGDLGGVPDPGDTGDLGDVQPPSVDDERCPDDLLGPTTIHAAGWTVWVCVHDPME